jgi:hypothetical protein
MTVNLIQLDAYGRESITPIFQNDEERVEWERINGLELACPGVIIFRHRLSDAGHYLCQSPAAHEGLVALSLCPPRYCGCLTCIKQRVAVRELTAWNISKMAIKLAHFELMTNMRKEDQRGGHASEAI